MNRYSRTFSAVALALGTLPVATLAHAADSPPTTPATITANRYSTTGADVIWARSTDAEGLVRGYEVFRDGVSLGIRDALSVTERGLVPGRSYGYSVAAVDSAGQRSAPIRITLNTKGFSNAASAPGIVPPTVPTPVKPPTTPVTPPAAGAPAAPTNPRSSAYSGTAGEIGWARPATAGLRYDVRRDGTLLTTTEKLSYVDRDLSPGRDYRYEIVAIDASGRRSAPASVTLRTQGTATSPNPFTPVSPTAPTAPANPAAPTAPTGLRTATYSSSSGELFWARPAVSGLRYDVSRDGVPVRSNLDGLSYYDGALVAGKNHRYDVVAIDAAGRRSAVASVTLQAKGGAVVPGAPSTPAPAAALSVDNAESVLVQLFDTLAGNGYADLVYGFGGNAIGRNVPDTIVLDDLRENNEVTKGDIVCQYGGSATYELGFFGDSSFDKLAFERCNANGASTIDGSMETSFASGRGESIRSTGRNFRIDRPNGGVLFDGSASTLAGLFIPRTSNLTGTVIFESKNGPFGVRDASIDRVCGEGDIFRNGVTELGLVRRTSGNFTYLPPVVPGAALNPEVTVRTTTGFSYESVYADGDPSVASPTFEKGRMTVTAKDGSRLDVDAGNGDKATYRLTATANGKSVTVTKPIAPLMKVFRKANGCG